MLAIRLQRTGRKGRANYRLVVQDSSQAPTSGKVVAMLGSYDPHAKTTSLSKEKAEFYLNNGAQPSERVASLLKREGVKLPSWVKLPEPREGKIRNPEKLRKNQPTEPETPEAAIEEAPAAKAAEEAPATVEEQAPSEEGTADVPAEEAPADADKEA